MLYLSLLFFIVSIIAATFGFGPLASATAGIAQILFFVFIVAFIISLILHLAKRIDRKTGI